MMMTTKKIKTKEVEGWDDFEKYFFIDYENKKVRSVQNPNVYFLQYKELSETKNGYPVFITDNDIEFFPIAPSSNNNYYMLPDPKPNNPFDQILYFILLEMGFFLSDGKTIENKIFSPQKDSFSKIEGDDNTLKPLLHSFDYKANLVIKKLNRLFYKNLFKPSFEISNHNLSNTVSYIKQNFDKQIEKNLTLSEVKTIFKAGDQVVEAIKDLSSSMIEEDKEKFQINLFETFINKKLSFIPQEIYRKLSGGVFYTKKNIRKILKRNVIPELENQKRKKYFTYKEQYEILEEYSTNSTEKKLKTLNDYMNLSRVKTKLAEKMKSENIFWLDFIPVNEKQVNLMLGKYVQDFTFETYEKDKVISLYAAPVPVAIVIEIIFNFDQSNLSQSEKLFKLTNFLISDVIPENVKSDNMSFDEFLATRSVNEWQLSPTTLGLMDFFSLNKIVSTDSLEAGDHQRAKESLALHPYVSRHSKFYSNSERNIKFVDPGIFCSGVANPYLGTSIKNGDIFGAIDNISSVLTYMGRETTPYNSYLADHRILNNVRVINEESFDDDEDEDEDNDDPVEVSATDVYELNLHIKEHGDDDYSLII